MLKYIMIGILPFLLSSCFSYYNNAEFQFQRPYSETTAKIMDDEVLNC